MELNIKALSSEVWTVGWLRARCFAPSDQVRLSAPWWSLFSSRVNGSRSTVIPRAEALNAERAYIDKVMVNLDTLMLYQIP